MAETKKKHPPIKAKLHPRNKHRERYNLGLLSGTCPELKAHLITNKYGDESIDFFNAESVNMLNKALLLHYYGLNFWEIPANYLCPPVPGRADYIHHAADLLQESMPDKKQIHCLDVGVGANCIYPVIGSAEYQWTFVGSDIDPIALESANKIVNSNTSLAGKIECRLQQNAKSILSGIIHAHEKFDLSICNPPFHASQKEAQAGTMRKLGNLKKQKALKAELNFGGQANELWTEGGEKSFILQMIKESVAFAKSCAWYSSLVSKESNLKYLQAALREAQVGDSRIIEMGQGNKSSRMLAWTFLSPEELENWK